MAQSLATYYVTERPFAWPFRKHQPVFNVQNNKQPTQQETARELSEEDYPANRHHHHPRSNRSVQPISCCSEESPFFLNTRGVPSAALRRTIPYYFLKHNHPNGIVIKYPLYTIVKGYRNQKSTSREVATPPNGTGIKYSLYFDLKRHPNQKRTLCQSTSRQSVGHRRQPCFRKQAPVRNEKRTNHPCKLNPGHPSK